MSKRPNLLRYDRRGSLVKWCRGCKQWLRVKEYSRRVKESIGLPKASEWHTLCRTCRNTRYDRTQHKEETGWIPVRQVWWIFDELTERVGMKQTCESIGMTDVNLRRILRKEAVFVQKRNVRRAINVLRKYREDNVFIMRTGRKPSYKKAA